MNLLKTQVGSQDGQVLETSSDSAFTDYMNIMEIHLKKY